MYTSLDRIDIVTERDDGRPLYVLTDHRTTAEMEEELDLSIVLALSRVLTVRRHAESADKAGDIRTACMERPPDALGHAIASAGSEVEVGDELVQYDDSGDPYALLDQAMARLAARTAAEEGIALDPDGLRAYERHAHAFAYDRDEDEIGWFTTLVRVAAVAGEVLRDVLHGHWGPDTQDFSFLAYTFVDGEGRLTNVLGRCERLLLHGPEQGPSVLLHVVADQEVEAGPLLPNLKRHDYGGLDRIVHEPLIRGEGALAVPLVAYGHDRPHTFQYLPPPEDGSKTDFDALRAEVRQNLASVDVTLEEVDLDGRTVLATTGSFYAAEKILDDAWMRELQERLDADILYASVPAKGMLLVMEADAANTAVFLAITQGRFDDASEEGTELSPLPFLVQDGEVVGFARVTPPTPTEEKPKRKGIFSWLFGGDA